MKKYAKFLLKWVLIFFVGSLLIFGIVRLLPTGPEVIYLIGLNAPLTPENIEMISRQMGLDLPLWEQYSTWILNFLRGDWGVSLISRVDIKTEFLAKMPYSICISVGGTLIGAIVSYYLGYLSAIRKGSFWDHLTSGIAILTQSVPGFILAMIIIYAFGVVLKIAKFFTGGATLSVITATLIVVIYRIGPLARVVRNSFREEMGKSYVKFAISRGMEKEKVLFHHAKKPVLCSLISALIPDFASAFGGGSILEFAFTIPGLSYFLVRSMRHSDYTVIQTYILVVIIWMFLVHLVLNILLDIIDVRRRK